LDGEHRLAVQTLNPGDGDINPCSPVQLELTGVATMIGELQEARAPWMVTITEVAPVDTIGNLNPMEQLLPSFIGEIPFIFL